MADHSLRVASRLLADTSMDPHTRAAVLAGLMREGRLQRERVELAAYLGDPAALLVAEPAVPAVPAWASAWSPARRVLRFGGLDQPALVRLAADCAERMLPIWESVHPDDPRPREAIEAARAWADCPCEGHRRAARAAAADAAWAADAADAAAWAADAADAAACAADAAAAAAPAACAADAADCAADAAADRPAEESWQAQHLVGRLLDPEWACAAHWCPGDARRW